MAKKFPMILVEAAYGERLARQDLDTYCRNLIESQSAAQRPVPRRLYIELSETVVSEFKASKRIPTEHELREKARSLLETNLSIARDQRRVALHRCLNLLSPDERKFAELVYERGLSILQAGELLGYSERQANTANLKMLRHLLDCLSEHT